MAKSRPAKRHGVKFPGNFAGEKMNVAAEDRPHRRSKKSVNKYKPGSK